MDTKDIKKLTVQDARSLFESKSIAINYEDNFMGMCSALLEAGYGKKDISDYMVSEFGEANKLSLTEFLNFVGEVEKKIAICEEAKAKQEEMKAAEAEAPKDDEPEGEAFGKQLQVLPDGSLALAAPGLRLNVGADRSLDLSLLESRKVNKLLKEFLTEDCGMSLNEFICLTEDTKVESIKELAIALLKSIEERLSAIDTSVADRSRGDVKKLPNLGSLQDAITRVEAILDRSEGISPIYSEYIATIVKAILFLNQYSAVFKDAYRNKKTVMVLKYQSLILAIISSFSYFLSIAMDYNARDVATIKPGADTQLMDYAPLEALKAFVRSVENGDFKKYAGDVNTIREFYLEVPVETMEALLEGAEYIPAIIQGIQGIYGALSGNGKLISVLYKAAGFVVLLLSLREVFYTLFKSKTRISEMLNGIDLFANLKSGAGMGVGKLAQFASKLASDAQFSSDIAKREIQSENKDLLRRVQSIQADNETFSAAPTPASAAPATTQVTSPSVEGQPWNDWDF